MFVKHVFDNEGETFDRYSVIFELHYFQYGDKPLYPVLFLSFNCDSTQGVSCWSHMTNEDIFEQFGKEIDFYDLPDHVRLHVYNRVNHD